jgi:hypothetical protein
MGKSTDNRFGGTDGNFHYNDTWCLDIASGEWQELSCIGYIPVPREGHAAAMVDDVIYVFGGRDVNGKDLGDLAAFRTTSMSLFPFSSFLFSLSYIFGPLTSFVDRADIRPTMVHVPKYGSCTHTQVGSCDGSCPRQGICRWRRSKCVFSSRQR